jgi:hypothetical protein
MNQTNDRALDVLQHIAAVWQIDSRRVAWTKASEQNSAGFDWWPGDFCVRVRAHKRGETPDPANFKVVIRTDFLKSVAIDTDRFEELAAILSRFATSTYAWIYAPNSFCQRFEPSAEKPSLWFSSCAYITPNSIGVMPNLLAHTGLIQPINAQIQAPTMAEMLGSGSPDTSRPETLKDAGLDGILETVAHVFAPEGERPSRWASTKEFEEFAENWAKSDRCFGFGDASGMTLETPFGSDSALIQLRTAEKHPQLGHGLLITLQLPYSADRLTIARQAAELNLCEYILWTDFPQLGCWHCNQSPGKLEGLAFSLFIPNALYQPDLATQIAFWFLRRARLVREFKFPEVEDLNMLEIFKKRDFLCAPIDIGADGVGWEEHEPANTGVRVIGAPRVRVPPGRRAKRK